MNYFNLLLNNSSSSYDIISDIFNYNGRVSNITNILPILSYYYLYFSNIISKIKGIKNEVNNLTVIVSCIKSIQLLLGLILPLYEKYSNEITIPVKELMIILKDLLNSEYELLLKPSVELYMKLYQSSFNLRDIEDNDLSNELKNINNFINEKLNGYITKYINNSSFDSNTEGKEYLIYIYIISQLSFSPYYFKELCYLNNLLIPLIRSDVYILLLFRWIIKHLKVKQMKEMKDILLILHKEN